MNTPRSVPLLALSSCLIAGCAAPATYSGAPLSYGSYTTQQTALKSLNDTGQISVKSYALSKAQCWLDVSLHEYSRNDRSTFPQEAFDESAKIASELKQGASLAAQQTPLLNGATMLREDLWAQAASLKKLEGFACAERQVACAEVELVHAGNEYAQQGWRHAKPYVQIAEDLLSDAKAAAAACPKPKPPPSIVPLMPEPVAVAPLAPIAKLTKTIEKITLNASALFKFDKRKTVDLLPQGKAQLDELAAKINSVYASVESIALVGYTDRLGSDAYNNTLSADRANAVKAYLQSKGVTSAMTTEGRGKAEPIAQCPGGNAPTAALTQCLQPNRRVEVAITGVKR